MNDGEQKKKERKKKDKSYRIILKKNKKQFYPILKSLNLKDYRKHYRNPWL